MPRTKVSRNSKRNRDAAIREEKIREFDSALEQAIDALDMKIKQDIQDIDTEIVLMKSRISQRALSMKLGHLLRMNVATFSEINTISNFAAHQPTESPLPCSLASVSRSRDDEGYLTEESAIGTGLANLSQMRIYPNTARIPGPLSSAKSRKSRRSRSACGYPSSALKLNPSANSGHMSRDKMRTPMTSRKKAISADRTMRDFLSSPTALLRWAKPGEMIISMTGSPVVAHAMPEKYANVNIPIRDGVLSLRPKKLQNLDPGLVHRMEEETLSQIRLLQSNLELIMSYANRI